MIKFVGSKQEFEEFMLQLKKDYGEKSTIKDICQMVGAYVDIR